MFEQQPQALRDKIKSLATESLRQQNPSGWFEPLYAEAEGDSSKVPWAKNQAHPYLQDWLEKYPPDTTGKTALVIGCGLGDDAETLANLGYGVTAFDISPSAINWCKQRFPQSSVTYLVADLFALDTGWKNKFDLVYECRNIQALPTNVRSQVINEIAPLVAENGKLLIVTRHRDNDTIPEGPPWAVSDNELNLFVEFGLQEVRRDIFLEGSEIIVKQVRIEYQSSRN